MKKSSLLRGLLASGLLLVVAYAWHQHRHGAPGRAAEQAAATHPDGVTGDGRTKPELPAPAALPRSRVAADGSVAIPVRFRLPGIDRAKGAPNFQAWLAAYPPYQQERIKAFDGKHFGVYRIGSGEQIAWMAENGYPMPEDLMAAEALSDAALFEMASQGNEKAGFLLIERRADQLAAHIANGGKQGDFFGGPEGTRRLQESLKLEQLMDRSNSPYKGYVQAYEAASGIRADPESADAQVIAGLLWANSLGDTRALPFAVEFARTDPVRRSMLNAALAVYDNDSSSMRYMEATGGQRPGAAPGRWIPGGGAPTD